MIPLLVINIMIKNLVTKLIRWGIDIFKKVMNIKIPFQALLSLAAITISGLTFYNTSLKPFKPSLYASEPVWYNYSHREDKITFRDAAVILPLILYNHGSQPGIIEEILLVLANKKEHYVYSPMFFVNNILPNLKFESKEILPGRITLGVEPNADFAGYFNPILLKPNEQKIMYLLFMPDPRPDRQPLEGQYVMRVAFSYKNKDKNEYEVYSKNISEINSKGLTVGLFSSDDSHEARDGLLKKVRKTLSF